MLRVGMDISQIAHLGGVSLYTQNLALQLSKVSDLEMVYFYSSFRKPYKNIGLKNVKSFRFPPSMFELFFNKVRNISIEKFIGPVDIFHSSDWTQPPTKALKVTTYHDVVPLKYPQWSHPTIISVHKRRIKLVEKEVDHVIAVSNATKLDLMEVSNIPEEKITVIYEAPSSNFKVQTEEKIRAFKRKYNLPDEFVLAIGGIGERRNLGRIKEACQGYNLVIAGQTLPWLSLEELELLYNSAKVLVYTSLYEGFGLPILDAYLCGLPVVTSNISSMPEIAGEAAFLADPLSVNDIREKLKILFNQQDVRNKLVKKGFERVKEFSWEKCAKETAAVYQRLYAKN